MRKPFEWLLWGLLLGVTLILVIAGLGSSGFGRGGGSKGEAPMIYVEVPDFTLVNRDGRQITKADFAGAPWVADFIFTRCPGICPRMSERMKEIADGLPPGSRVRMASISVDPEFDTPEVLDRYATALGAVESWYFLTGERQEIYTLSRDGFKLPVNPEPPAESDSIEPILHSNRLVLVDAEARIRGYYNAFDREDIDRLRQDLELLREDT